MPFVGGRCVAVRGKLGIAGFPVPVAHMLGAVWGQGEQRLQLEAVGSVLGIAVFSRSATSNRGVPA